MDRTSTQPQVKVSHCSIKLEAKIFDLTTYFLGVHWIPSTRNFVRFLYSRLFHIPKLPKIPRNIAEFHTADLDKISQNFVIFHEQNFIYL